MVTREQKIWDLRHKIAEQLNIAIDRDYVLLGLPYYLNIGDILIWEGERQYLSSREFKCLNEGWRYRNYQRIGQDTLILLQGGGNFGDLYRSVQTHRLRTIQRYGSNPIVIFPVSCWYSNPILLRRDAEIFSRHPALTICARDLNSFEFLNKHFTNNILLVPDMAFGINTEKVKRCIPVDQSGILYHKRNDQELRLQEPLLPKSIVELAEVRDWPSLESDPLCWSRYYRIVRSAEAMGECRGMYKLSQIMLMLSDWYYHKICREELIREGVNFLGRYSDIYTTRLHGAILAILMDNEVTIIDNSYGKNSSFFKTWLTGTEGVRLWNSND